VFPKRDSRRIHDSQVVSKGFKKLNFAILEHVILLKLDMKVSRRNDLSVDILQRQCAITIEVHTCDLIEELNIGKQAGHNYDECLVHY
jgi:hypothetical protein